MDAKLATLHEFAPASELGPAEDYPIGSIEWAERISNRLQIGARSVNQHTVHHLWNTIKAIWGAHPHPWEIWPKPPFGTPDDYCAAVTGHSWTRLVDIVSEFAGEGDELDVKTMMADLARAQAVYRPQGKHHGFPSLYNKGESHGGTRAAYLLRRLARERPDLLTAYESGRFKSVRAAAIEAGFVTPPSALDRLRKAWKAATRDERAEFLAEISAGNAGNAGSVERPERGAA